MVSQSRQQPRNPSGAQPALGGFATGAAAVGPRTRRGSRTRTQGGRGQGGPARTAAGASGAAASAAASAAAAAELQQLVDRHVAGELEAAEAGYRRFLERHHDFPVAYSNLAALLLGRGDHQQAAALAQRAIELQPDYRSAWQNRLEALQALGQLPEAIDAARQLLALEPGDAAVTQRLARLLLDAGERQQAADTLGELLLLRPDCRQTLQSLSVVQLELGHPEALATSAAALALDPDDGDLRFNHAQALLAAGEAQRGEALLRELLQQHPQHRHGCRRLAGLLDQRQEAEAALAVYEAALAADEPWVEGWFQLGLRRLQLGREGGRQAYERVLELDPNHALTLSNLAVQDLAAGETALAAERLERALAVEPGFADALFNLGVVRRQQGDLEAAEALYRRTLELSPGYGKAACNLGSVLNDRGAFAEARPWLEQALRLQPDLGEAHFNLAVCLQRLGAAEQAERHLRRSLELLPGFSQGWLHLADLLHGMGRHRQAIEAYDRLLELDPGNLQGRINRSIQYLRLRLPQRAVEELEAFTEAEPDHALAWQQLGNALLELNRYSDSLAASERAISLNPNLAVAHSNRGVALQNLKRLDEAAPCYRRATELEPSFADAHYNLGVLLKERGCFSEAAESYRKAIALRPDYGNALSNLVYLLSFSQIETQQSILAASSDWVRAFCVPRLEPFRQRPIPDDRPLRLGVISAEIGNHAVSYFLRSYLEHYDHSRTHVHLYAALKRDEARKLEMFALVEGAREIHGLSDAEARERIFDDGIDILIDTTSHMRGNRLPLLAERCAPVQAHWIGFHGSTAVPAVDWFIGDGEVTPPAFADHFSERLWRLPLPWVCYWPPSDAPQPEPVEHDGPVTLGSFNNLLKVGEACLDLYGQVLAAIPDSRLLLKDGRCEDGLMRQRILERLAGWGIAPERIELVERVASWHDHMALYNRLDVALDTTPLNSGTTGFDALFMGTPLVALRGDWMGGRLTASMLKALGRPEWVAESPEAFVHIVQQLSADRRALRQLRSGLRQQVLASPLCDGAAMGRALDGALVELARDHNQRLAAPANARSRCAV